MPIHNEVNSSVCIQHNCTLIVSILAQWNMHYNGKGISNGPILSRHTSVCPPRVPPADMTSHQRENAIRYSAEQGPGRVGWGGVAATRRNWFRHVVTEFFREVALRSSATRHSVYTARIRQISSSAVFSREHCSWMNEKTSLESWTITRACSGSLSRRPRKPRPLNI